MWTDVFCKVWDGAAVLFSSIFFGLIPLINPAIFRYSVLFNMKSFILELINLGFSSTAVSS